MFSNNDQLIQNLEKYYSSHDYWTCFEVLFLHAGQATRHVLQIQAEPGLGTIDTFKLQKALQKSHSMAFDSAEHWLEVARETFSWPEHFKLSLIEEGKLEEFSFENHISETQRLLTTLRFICPQSSQPFYGHLRYDVDSNDKDQEAFLKEKLMWSLLQIRSEPLETSCVGQRLQQLCENKDLKLHWSLSRRGGISYQGATYQALYQRSVVE